MELSTRPYANAGMALTTATAIAFAPMALHNPPSVHLPLPHITAPNIALTAQITSADIKALVANLDAALGAATDTVSTVAGVPGQTVVQALTTATSLNDNLWNGLISATANPALANVLTALRKTISGALTQLSKTVAPLNSDITLTTEQLGTLLTSVVTGWVGTAGQTVANLVTNPLAVSSYTGLLTAPLDMAGLGLINVITAADNLGANGLSAVHTVVTGITAQISNALSGVENLVGSVADLTGSSLVTGITTALQGIVSAPVTAVLAGVDGISNTAVTAAKQALDDVSDGARGLVKVWLGNGTSGGAIQGVLNTIGSAPLDVASYAHAVSIAVGAAINTGTVVLHTAGSMVSIPFTAGANLTTTAANVITSFVSGMAKASSGLLTAFGLGAVSGVPYAVATVVNGAVNLAATVTAAGFNTIAAALNAGSAITGALTGAAAVADPQDAGRGRRTQDSSGNDTIELIGEDRERYDVAGWDEGARKDRDPCRKYYGYRRGTQHQNRPGREHDGCHDQGGDQRAQRHNSAGGDQHDRGGEDEHHQERRRRHGQDGHVEIGCQRTGRDVRYGNQSGECVGHRR